MTTIAITLTIISATIIVMQIRHDRNEYFKQFKK